MRTMVLGALLGAGLAVVALGVWETQNEAFAQKLVAYPQRDVEGSPLVVVPMAGQPESGLLTVIDPNRRVMGVYHVDPASGKIGLRSVRNMSWDLHITYLNNEEPLPRDIQLMLEQR